MPTSSSYRTYVAWRGGSRGHLICGNGAEMDFAAPPDAHGLPGVLTPEDALVAAANTCIMLVFLRACERLEIPLVSYSCEAEGTKVGELDRTERMSEIMLRPRICVEPCDDQRVRHALQAAQQYSLIANSIRSEVIIEPEIIVQSAAGS